MTVATWPAELPQNVLVNGFGLTRLTLAELRTKPDVGPAKVRLLATAAVTPVSCQISVDPDEMSRFDRFCIEELNYRSDPFYIRDQIYDGLDLTDQDGNVLTDENDNALLVSSNWLVVFNGAPRTSGGDGLNFTVQFELEILP